jgi:hypothetical protein
MFGIIAMMQTSSDVDSLGKLLEKLGATGKV